MSESDKLTGGAGADTFVFAQGDGHDLITDFELARDVIDLTALDLGGFSDISIGTGTGGATVSVDDIVIDLGGIVAAQLTEDHFLL